MFEAFAAFYEENGLHRCSHTNVEYYTIAHRFFQSLHRGDEELFQWYAKFDLYSHEKARKLPDWLTVSLHEAHKTAIYAFYEQADNRERLLPEFAELDTKQLYRQAHIEVFPFNPLTGEQRKTPILFNYRRCDLLGNAEHTVITLD